MDIDQDEENIVDLFFPNVDNSSESDEKPVRSSRTKYDQLQKLYAFMETHSDFTKGKTSDKQASEWNVLTEELNGMGPPVYSNKRWRKVWSDHKGNKKRKKSTKTATQLKTFVDSTSLSEQVESSILTISGKNDDHDDMRSGKTDLKNNDEKAKNCLTDIQTKLRKAIQLQKESNKLIAESIQVFEANF